MEVAVVQEVEVQELQSMSACRLRGAGTQTKKLSNGKGAEVTIDANGHCELPAAMMSVPRDAFWHWDGHRKGCKALKSISIPSSVKKLGCAACPPFPLSRCSPLLPFTRRNNSLAPPPPNPVLLLARLHFPYT